MATHKRQICDKFLAILENLLILHQIKLLVVFCMVFTFSAHFAY